MARGGNPAANEENNPSIHDEEKADSAKASGLDANDNKLENQGSALKDDE